MKILNKTYSGNRFFLFYLFPAFMIVMIFSITSCKEKPHPWSVLEFSGKGSVMNYSKSPLLTSYESDSANPTALIARDGDLLMLNDNGIFYYRGIYDQNKFQFKSTEEADYINGKIVSVNIPKKKNIIPWLSQINSTDLSKLDFLRIDSLIPENYMPWLTELAKTKPGIGLGYYGGELKNISELFKLFNPRIIIGGTIYQKDYNILSGLDNLELLLVSLEDSVSNGPLPPMPHLKQLILGDMKNEAMLTNNLLINNKQIEKLVIVNSHTFNFALISPLVNLKELIINGSDTIENSDLIKNHRNLEVLSVISKTFKIGNEVNELPDIRWMSFSSDITQNEFNLFLEKHPDLEVAEIIKNDTISSLRSLLSLKKLYGLTITDTLTDYATIKSLKNLKYLSLPDKIIKDSIKKTELNRLLPGTKIVANQGFCLGSGWLLLIIPLILLFSIFSYHRARIEKL